MEEDERYAGEPGERRVADEAGYVEERCDPEDGIVVADPYPAWQASALNATFECVSIAPLGLPVVPEV